MRNCAAVSPRPTSDIILTLFTLPLSSVLLLFLVRVSPRSCSFAPRSCLRVRRTQNTNKKHWREKKKLSGVMQTLTQIVRYYSCTTSTLFFIFLFHCSPPLCFLNCSQRSLMTPTAASGICMIYLLRKCCTLQRTCAALRYRFALLYKMCNKISAKKLFCIKIPCAASTATGRE